MAEPTIFETYLKQLKQATLPRWTDLPEFDLYMDQVVQYVNRVITPLGLEELTPTMVNFYVKQKVVPAPQKKKYGRAQIARLVAIAILKPVFSIESIGQGMAYQLINRKPAQVFDAFILQFIAAVGQLDANFKAEVTINRLNQADTTNLQGAMVTLAINAVLEKLLVETMTAHLNPNRQGQ